MRLPLAAAFACVGCLVSVPARAELITLQFTGTITGFTDGWGSGYLPQRMDEVFSVGDGFEIYFRYDDTPNPNPLVDHHEEYWGSIGFHQLARSSSVTFYHLTGSPNSYWEDDRTRRTDPPEYQPLTLADGSEWRVGFIESAIYNSGILEDGPLITPATRAIYGVYFLPVVRGSTDPYGQPFSMATTQVRRVPEPSTIALLGLGMVATVFRYRRSR